MEVITNNMRHAKIMAAVMAAVLTVSAFMPVCAMADVNVSDRMVGEGKLIEKTDGLTRLDDAERASFMDALDKKYSKEAVQDYNGEAKMEIKAKKPVKQLFGSKVDVSAGVDVAFADSEHSSSSIAECNIKTSALFMNDSMSMTSYLDKETGTEHRRVSGKENSSEWKKKQKKHLANNETEIPFLNPDKIREVYRDPETGAYAAVVEIEREDIEKIAGQGVEEMEKLGLNDKDLKKGTYIVTLDEGVAVIGLYGELREAFESKEFSITSCTVRALLKGINTGLRIEEPEGIEK